MGHRDIKSDFSKGSMSLLPVLNRDSKALLLLRTRGGMHDSTEPNTRKKDKAKIMLIRGCIPEHSINSKIKGCLRGLVSEASVLGSGNDVGVLGSSPCWAPYSAGSLILPLPLPPLTPACALPFSNKIFKKLIKISLEILIFTG